MLPLCRRARQGVARIAPGSELAAVVEPFYPTVRETGSRPRSDPALEEKVAVLNLLGTARSTCGRFDHNR